MQSAWKKGKRNQNAEKSSFEHYKFDGRLKEKDWCKHKANSPLKEYSDSFISLSTVENLMYTTYTLVKSLNIIHFIFVDEHWTNPNDRLLLFLLFSVCIH